MSTDTDIKEVLALIDDDFQAVNSLIKNKLASKVVLVNQIGNYIVHSGGKRLRPILVLLAARACGYRGEQHINLAAVIEFIHTATLLHDDVVDASELRRGEATANALFGNEASVLVGDFLYSRSFQMMVESDDLRVMQILADATNIIAEGEVLQLLNCNNPDTTEEEYLAVIHYKTAKLFEAGTRLGAIVSNSSSEVEEAMANYGKHLGSAFQLVDDALDYTATSEELGKNVGDDLAEGKPTMPLLYAMHNSDTEDADLIKQAIIDGSNNQNLDKTLEKVLKIIEQTGAIDYTVKAAKREAELAIAALSPLADSDHKDALIKLAKFSVERSH